MIQTMYKNKKKKLGKVFEIFRNPPPQWEISQLFFFFFEPFPKCLNVIVNSKKIISLSTANTEVRNLKQENALLRANLKEYQKELDEVEIAQVRCTKYKIKYIHFTL